MGAGLALSIEHAGDDELEAGIGGAYLDGASLFLLALVVMRSVTVAASRRLGVTLKLCAVTLLLTLIAAHAVVSPILAAAALALVLASLVAAEHVLLPEPG